MDPLSFSGCLFAPGSLVNAQVSSDGSTLDEAHLFVQSLVLLQCQNLKWFLSLRLVGFQHLQKFHDSDSNGGKLSQTSVDPCFYYMVAFTAEVDIAEKSHCFEGYGVEHWTARADYFLVVCYLGSSLVRSYFNFISFAYLKPLPWLVFLV